MVYWYQSHLIYRWHFKSDFFWMWSVEDGLLKCQLLCQLCLFICYVQLLAGGIAFELRIFQNSVSWHNVNVGSYVLVSLKFCQWSDKGVSPKVLKKVRTDNVKKRVNSKDIGWNGSLIKIPCLPNTRLKSSYCYHRWSLNKFLPAVMTLTELENKCLIYETFIVT